MATKNIKIEGGSLQLSVPVPSTGTAQGDWERAEERLAAWLDNRGLNKAIQWHKEARMDGDIAYMRFEVTFRP